MDFINQAMQVHNQATEMQNHAFQSQQQSINNHMMHRGTASDLEVERHHQQATADFNRMIKERDDNFEQQSALAKARFEEQVANNRRVFAERKAAMEAEFNAFGNSLDGIDSLDDVKAFFNDR